MQLADVVRTDILKALAADQLDLPVLPETALRIREAADDPNIDAPRLARVLAGDAAVAARVLRIANSPLMRGSQAINDLKLAVSRLGIPMSANLATGFAMENMFQATSEAIDTKMREIWQRATDVAAMSAAIARTYTRLKPDQAMLAGLTHSIGALPVLAWAEADDRLCANQATLTRIIEAVQPEVGAAILARWEFPPEIASVPVACHDLARDVGAPDYADIVTVARLQCSAGSPGAPTLDQMAEIPAFVRLGIDPRQPDEEFQAMVAEVRSAMG
jgi:HD-like signal output (HDOD) protein